MRITEGFSHERIVNALELEKRLRAWFGLSRLSGLLGAPEASEKRLKLLLLIGLAAIAVIYFSDYGKEKVKTTTLPSPAGRETSAEDGSATDDAYAARMEQRLTEMITAIEGAGEVKVMVTLECGTEYVYASRQKSTSALTENQNGRDEKRTGEESLILVDGGSGEEPLLLKEITPTVAGVVVVCTGADDAAVRQRVVDVVTTALGTTANRVCVTRMKTRS